MGEDLHTALRTYVSSGEPPLTITSASVISRGRRLRRIRRAGALAAVTAVGALGLAAVLAVTPLVGDHVAAPAWVDLRPVCGRPTGSTDIDDIQDRITCYLTSTVPTLVPGASFARLHGPDGVPPLTAYPSTDIPNGYDAGALVKDVQGIGSLSFSVAPPHGGPPTRQACASKGNCELRTGPHGETVAVYTSSGSAGEDRGFVGYTIYAYLPGALVIAASSNADDRLGGSRPTRYRPFLDIDALVTLATDPQLSVFA